MENRKYNFNGKDFNSRRVEEVLRYNISKLNFKEICKMFRDICYDRVAYYSKDLCADIYKDPNNDPLYIEQCCRLQRKVSTAVDIFEQAITDGRMFDENYLEERLGK